MYPFPDSRFAELYDLYKSLLEEEELLEYEREDDYDLYSYNAMLESVTETKQKIATLEQELGWRMNEYGKWVRL